MSQNQNISEVSTHLRELAQYLAHEGYQIIIVPQTLTANTKTASPGLARPASPSVVDLKSLKRLVSQLLPASSPVRSLILSENDTLPTEEAFMKFGVFDRLLWNELNS